MGLIILVKRKHERYTNRWKQDKLVSITTEPDLGKRLLVAKEAAEKIIVINPDLGTSFLTGVTSSQGYGVLWNVEFSSERQASCEKPRVEFVQGTIGAEVEGNRILKTY